MEAQKIERLETHFESSNAMTIRQTRKGWLQECLGCEASTEFRWFQKGDTKEENAEFATSVEESNCLIRICCAPNHPFTMTVKELNSDIEILSMDRPCFCPPGSCKCCCYQEMTLSSGGQPIGSIKEQFYCCVPRFKIKDSEEKPIYKVHQPTCCGGFCVNCCTEGNPCGRGCCKVAFHVFPADQEETDGDVPPIAKIVKVPKSLGTELFTDADAFDVTFPDGANSTQKALLAGTSVFLNALYFEETDGGGD